MGASLRSSFIHFTNDLSLILMSDTKIAIAHEAVRELAAAFLTMFCVGLSTCDGEEIVQSKKCAEIGSWAVQKLLSIGTANPGQLDWQLLTRVPQVAFSSLLPVLQACLDSSLPGQTVCLLSRGRQLAASPGWEALSDRERVCLALVHDPGSPIIERLVTLASVRPDSPFRLVTLTLTEWVSLVLVCGSQLSLDSIQPKLVTYWGPVLVDLERLESRRLLYARTGSVSESARAFIVAGSRVGARPSPSSSSTSGASPLCCQGYLRLGDRDGALDEAMQLVYEGLMSSGHGTWWEVVRDTEKNFTLVGLRRPSTSLVGVVVLEGCTDSGANLRAAVDSTLTQVGLWARAVVRDPL